MSRFMGWKNITPTKPKAEGVKPKKPRNQVESKIQVECVTWFREQFPGIIILSIPNASRLAGDVRQRAMQWTRLKAEGATPGAADLFIVASNGIYHGLFVEMKTLDGSQTKTQKSFQASAENAKYKYSICKSLEAFKAEVNEYFYGSNENSFNI